MLKSKFLIESIFVEFEGHIIQLIIGIPMGTNCVHLLPDISMYSYETVFIQTLIKDKSIKEVKAFNLSFRYIDDVLSNNNPHSAS